VEEKIASEEDTQKVDEQKDKKIVLKDENTEKSDIKKSSDKKVLVKSEQKNQIEAEFSRMNNLVQNQEKNISEIHAEKISTEELKINFDGKKAKVVQEEKNDSTEENIVFAELLNSDISENQIDFTEQKFSKDVNVKSKKVQTLDKDGKISVTDLRTKEAEINEDFAQTQKDFTSEVKFEDDNSATITMNLNQENVETNLLSTSNQTAASDGSNFQAMLNNQIKANAPEFVKTGSIVLRDNNQGTINLILHPDEIGSVKIHLSLDGKTVSGQITVATKEAMEVFKNNAETLREAFIQQGFDVGGFDVAYSDNGSFSNQEQFAQENNEKLMANYAQNCYENGTDEVFENFDENTNKFSDYSINIVA
jgi:flagellar hook-length control protein FliK